MNVSRLKSTLFASKVRSFAPIMEDLATFPDRAKFVIGVFINFLVPALVRRVRYTMVLRFKKFYVKYRVGQGELSPYLEIKDAKLQGLSEARDVKMWTVVDCGANIGLFSLFFRNAGRVIAIEPNLECGRRLSYNLKRNSVRAIIIRKAVSSQEGPLRMVQQKTNTTQSYVADEGTLEVQATTIDHIVAAHNIDSIDLLKLDVEGHEIEALRGALFSCKSGIVKRIYAEFRKDEALEDLDNFLVPLNYERVAIIHWWNALYELRVATV